jgi:glutaredoxin
MDTSVTVYTTPTCPDCHALKRWFAGQGIAYEERDLTDPAVMEEAKARTGMRVAPITFVGEQFFYGTYGEQRPKIAAALGFGSGARSEKAHP